MLVIQTMLCNNQVKPVVPDGSDVVRTRGVVKTRLITPWVVVRRASGGHPRSAKGIYAKGLKTRAPKKHSSKYIVERRKKK